MHQIFSQTNVGGFYSAASQISAATTFQVQRVTVIVKPGSEEGAVHVLRT